MESFNELRRKVLFEALEKFPGHGDRTVAMYLFNKYPEYWNSLDAVRGRVRRQRGHYGDYHRKYLKIKQYVKPLQFTRIIRDEI